LGRAAARDLDVAAVERHGVERAAREATGPERRTLHQEAPAGAGERHPLRQRRRRRYEEDGGDAAHIAPFFGVATIRTADDPPLSCNVAENGDLDIAIVDSISSSPHHPATPACLGVAAPLGSHTPGPWVKQNRTLSPSRGILP